MSLFEDKTSGVVPQTILVVLTEQAHAVEPLSKDLLEIIKIGELSIHIFIGTNPFSWGDIKENLTDKGIPYNLGVFHNAEYQISHYKLERGYARFEHTGELKTGMLRSSNISTDLRDLMHTQWSGNHPTRVIDRIISVLYGANGWENQVEYGKLYRTMKLIGAVD